MKFKLQVIQQKAYSNKYLNSDNDKPSTFHYIMV